MAKTKDKDGGLRRPMKWNFRRGLEDMRAGLDEDARDNTNLNLAKMARTLGFAMAVAAVLYLVAALRTLGIFN